MDARPYPTLVARDAYDEAAFKRALEGSKTLRDRVEAGQRLHPGFEALAQDVFTLLFKYTTVIDIQAQESASGRAELARRVLGWVRAAREFERLRAETVLDEGRATYGTGLVLEHVLRTLRRPELFSEEELLEDFEINALEQRLEELEELTEGAQELADALAQGEEEPSAPFEEAVAALEGEASAVEEALAKLRRKQLKRLDALPASLESQLRDLTEALPERMESGEQELQDFGRQLGVGLQSGMPAAARLELGERLLTHDKLRRLARLVGAFREFARGLRRARFERRPAELHAVERGQDLGRLLPVEVGQLRHPQLRKVFKRRYIEGDLLQYAIEAQDRGQRGPMVVCLDGSGSMAGDKDTWAKAVCLTLLEIARRQRRHFRAVVFSGGRQDMRVFDLLRMPGPGRLEAPPVEVSDLVALADCFPGGGTNFMAPLDKALEILQDKKLRRGDIVFITDGEANVSDPWLTHFLEVKRKLDFKIYGVLVDRGRGGAQDTPQRASTLARFADRVTSVSRLTAEDAKDLFLSL